MHRAWMAAQGPMRKGILRKSGGGRCRNRRCLLLWLLMDLTGCRIEQWSGSDSEMTMKYPKIIAICMLIIFPIILPCAFLGITGKVSLSYSGFAVDQDSNLYIGRDSIANRICMIDVVAPNGEVLRQVSAQTSRGYCFDITKDNILRINVGSFVYETDLYGNVIRKKKTAELSYDQIPSTRIFHRFSSPDGHEYVARNPFFRPCVYRVDGNTKTLVYQMPLFDYVVKVVMMLAFLGLFIVIPIGIYQSRKS